MKVPFLQNEALKKFDLESLLKLKDRELSEALAPLKFEEVLELVLQIPWENRAKIILASPYAEGLVQNLSPIELFFTLKASSLDLAVELLSKTRPTQLTFLLDFDCWYKDRIKTERVASWIILLFEAGEDKVLQWLAQVDWDFLIALMQKFVKVYKRPDDVDLIEARDYLPPYTLDDVYFIEFKDERLEYYFRRIIEIIRDEWPETYFSLMEAIIIEIPIEVEERAFRWRNGRLADEGIPDYYTALEIYTYIHPKSLSKIDPKILALPGEVSPNFYLMAYEGESQLFIHQVLSSIKDLQQKQRIQQEMAWLATKVILVDYPVIDGIEEVKKGLLKMWCSLNLGLEYLTDGDILKAKEILENHYLEDIFRVSCTALRELRKFALSLFNQKDFSAGLLKYLDQPYAGYLQGVIAKKLNQVRLFNPVNIGTADEYTYFSKVSELRMVRRYLEEIAYMAPLIEKGLGPLSLWITEVSKPKRNFDLNNLTWSSIILTSLAQYLYKGEFCFKALPLSSWKGVFKELTEQRNEKTYLKEELKKTLYESFIKHAQRIYYVDEELLRSFLDFVIDRFEKEFLFANPEDPPDPKYQTLILIDLSL